MSPRIAKADTVDLAELLDFMRPRHRMVLTTFRADGALQSSPVTGGVDEHGRLVADEHPDWAEYREAMVNQGKCLIRVTPQSWGPVATGGFPPS